MPKIVLMRTNTVAQKLGVNLRTLYRYFNKGYIDSIKPAGIIYVTKAELTRFIRKRKREQIRKNNHTKSAKGPRRMVRRPTNNTRAKQNITPKPLDHSHNIANK